MLDPKLLRSDLDSVTANLARRGFQFPAGDFESLESRRKAAQVSAEELRNERNTRSKAIGKAKAAGEDIAGPLYLLGAFLFLSVSLVPLASAAAIRISLD